MLPSDYVVVDLETTDRAPDVALPVEIAVLVVRSDQIVWRWVTLCNPGVPSSPGAQEVHGIAPADVAAAPPLADLVLEIAAGMDQGLPVVAYNAPYDRAILKRVLGPLFDPSWQWVDPLQVARDLMPGRSHKLGHVASTLGVVYPAGTDAHRALADAEVTVGVVAALRSMQERKAEMAELAAVMPAILPRAPGGDLVTQAQAALVPLAGKIKGWVEQSQGLTCDDDAQDAVVVDAIGTFKSLRAEAEKLRLKYTDDIGRQKRAIEAVWRDQALRPVEAAIAALERLREPLARQRLERAAAERARLAAEAEAIAEQQRATAMATVDDAALAAMLDGDVDAVARRPDMVAVVNDQAQGTYEAVLDHAAAVKAAPVRGTVAVAHDRPVWQVRVVAPAVVPIQYWSPDEAKLLAAVQAADGDIQIPGVEITMGVSTSTRRR